MGARRISARRDGDSLDNSSPSRGLRDSKRFRGSTPAASETTQPATASRKSTETAAGTVAAAQTACDPTAVSSEANSVKR